MRINRLLASSVALALVVSACTGSQTEKDEPASESETKKDREKSASIETDWDGHKRLPETVVPISYDLTLTIDPSKQTFQGQTEVAVEVKEKTDRIRMHAEDLEISNVAASWTGIKETGSAVVGDEQRVEGQAHLVDNGGLVAEFERPLEPGKVTLAFEYSAPLDDVPEGLYRVKDGGNWYAFSQFQPLEAREAYPSFDEPTFKTPFQTTLRVPKGMVAATSTPVVDKKEIDDGDMVEWTFGETRPLPSYLVAFAVGDFDVVEAPKDALGDVPLRVLAPKGQGDLAEYALEKSPALVDYQETYFGSEFPYDKLDLVAVPNFSAGAMENVGLVTFRESLLLVDPKQASARDKMYTQGVMAHEYAHMWFGNLVTPNWWDDLWLNEAFATWMGRKTLQEVAPKFEVGLSNVTRMIDVMQQDSLEQSRAIHQPIEHGGDVYNAFDGITYTKGRAVLAMVETWLGEKDFRAGVRDHIEAHTDGTATTEDLLGALAEASGEPVADVTRHFLKQPGVPLVTVDYDKTSCESSGKATLQLEQTRYQPVGSDLESGKPWKIPMCVEAHGAEGNTTSECFLFDGTEKHRRQETVTLETDGCPTWVHPNAGEKGYYHWTFGSPSRYDELLSNRDALEMRERVALLGHMRALVRGDALPVEQYLETLATMATEETHRFIVQHVVGTLYAYEDLVYEGKPSKAYRDFVGSLVTPHVDRIGYEPKKGESTSAKMLRSTVMTAAANLAGNQDLVERARKDVAAFLENPTSATPTTSFALSIAAHHGDAELWNRIREHLDAAPTPSLRAEMLGALGNFQQPELAKKALDLFLTDTIRAQNLWRVLGPVSSDPTLQSVAWTWLTDNYDAVLDKVGKVHAGRLPGVGSGFCSKDQKKKLETFFSKEKHRSVGTPRNLAQTLESIDQCIAHRSLVADGVRGYVEN